MLARDPQARGELFDQRDAALFVAAMTGQYLGRSRSLAEIMHQHREAHYFVDFASRGLLDLIAAGEGPSRRMLALGYAGWSGGQLDGEFTRGVWVPVDLDDEIVFDVPAENRWHAALTSAGIDPARMSGTGGFSA